MENIKDLFEQLREEISYEKFLLENVEYFLKKIFSVKFKNVEHISARNYFNFVFEHFSNKEKLNNLLSKYLLLKIEDYSKLDKGRLIQYFNYKITQIEPNPAIRLIFIPFILKFFKLSQQSFGLVLDRLLFPFEPKNFISLEQKIDEISKNNVNNILNLSFTANDLFQNVKLNKVKVMEPF